MSCSILAPLMAFDHCLHSCSNLVTTVQISVDWPHSPSHLFPSGVLPEIPARGHCPSSLLLGTPGCRGDCSLEVPEQRLSKDGCQEHNSSSNKQQLHTWRVFTNLHLHART